MKSGAVRAIESTNYDEGCRWRPGSHAIPVAQHRPGFAIFVYHYDHYSCLNLNPFSVYYRTANHAQILAFHPRRSHAKGRSRWQRAPKPLRLSQPRRRPPAQPAESAPAALTCPQHAVLSSSPPEHACSSPVSRHGRSTRFAHTQRDCLILSSPRSLDSRWFASCVPAYHWSFTSCARLQHAATPTVPPPRFIPPTI